MARLRGFLGAADAIWPSYVDRDWLSDILREGPTRAIDDAVLWHCVGFELWLRRHHRSSGEMDPDAPTVLMREKAG